MGIDNFIQTAINNVLKNPILFILRDINFSSILKKSRIFIKSEKLMIKITKYDLFSSLYCKAVLFLKSQSLKIVIEYIKDISKSV
jgi:hypothetical protein